MLLWMVVCTLLTEACLVRGVVILFSYATKLIRLTVKMSIIRHKLVIIKTLPLTFGIVIYIKKENTLRLIE